MPVYLPIAEISVNLFLIVGLGGFVGLLSGMFGVGGGFLATPLLMFIGVPPAVAVASSANQITGASVSGALAYWRRGGIDMAMGAVLIAGGGVGSWIGAWAFKTLEKTGQLDLMIALTYVVFLGSIGGMMLREALNAAKARKAGIRARREKRGHDHWINRLPLKVRFRKSRLYISILVPLVVGVGGGILSAIMGVGGGFIMVPAMIYLIGMPTEMVIGTSLLQITFVTATVTFLHSVNTQSVDAVLALLLLFGAVVGAQVGVRIGMKLKPENMRIGLGAMVLAVAVKMAFDLVLTPDDLYSITPVAG